MVQLPGAAGGQPATLALRDALGRVVRTATVALPASGLPYELSVAGLPGGVYSLQVQTGVKMVVHRLAIY